MIYVIHPHGVQVAVMPRSPTHQEIGELLADESDAEGSWALVTLHVLRIGGQRMQLLHDSRPVGDLNHTVTNILRNTGDAEAKVYGKAVVLTQQNMLDELMIAAFNEGEGHA